MIAFITGNRCFGNIVRDFRLMKEIRQKDSVEILHFVPETLEPLYKNFSTVEQIEPEHYFYALERQSLSRIHRILAEKQPAVVVSDLAFFGPILCNVLGLKNILITQPYPIRGMYADNYNNCVESLQCADSIILPVPSFFEPDPELEKHKDKLMVVGPLLPREESGTTGEHLLITYSSGFYGLRVHFSVLESVERILDVGLDLRILLHAGGLSSKEEIRQLVKKVETLGYCGQITVLGFVDSLVDLLKASKAVVCHGGNIMFEAAMVGVPRLLVVPPLEQNTEHYKNAQYLQRIGAAELAVLGDPLEEHIISILTDERVRRYHTEVGKRMCSWNGLEKTAQVIMNTLK